MKKNKKIILFVVLILIIISLIWTKFNSNDNKINRNYIENQNIKTPAWYNELTPENFNGKMFIENITTDNKTSSKEKNITYEEYKKIIDEIIIGTKINDYSSIKIDNSTQYSFSGTVDKNTGAETQVTIIISGNYVEVSMPLVSTDVYLLENINDLLSLLN